LGEAAPSGEDGGYGRVIQPLGHTRRLWQAKHSGRDHFQRYERQPPSAGRRDDAALAQKDQRHKIHGQEQRDHVRQSVTAFQGKSRDNPGECCMRKRQRQHGEEQTAASKHAAQDQTGEKQDWRKKAHACRIVVQRPGTHQ